jgi:hypothetical protein
MADNLTNAEENRLLDLSLPTGGTIYLALYTAAPSDAGGGTEVAGGGYARQALSVPAASNGQKSNSLEVLFPEATADWGTIVALGVVDASTNGTLRWYRALDASEQRTVRTGDQYRVAPGALTFTLS